MLEVELDRKNVERPLTLIVDIATPFALKRIPQTVEAQHADDYSEGVIGCEGNRTSEKPTGEFRRLCRSLKEFAADLRG
jgi:hypothetical protein